MPKNLKRATNSEEFVKDGLYSEQAVHPREHRRRRGQALHEALAVTLGELSDELLCVGRTRERHLKAAAIAIIRIL